MKRDEVSAFAHYIIQEENKAYADIDFSRTFLINGEIILELLAKFQGQDEQEPS